jgi:hypothetical protein
MSEKNIRKHLRAALEEVISAEKSRLHEVYDEIDAATVGCIKMMTPVIEALISLKAEVGEVEGLEISLAPHGHMATIRMNSFGSRHFLSVSTNVGNSRFEVDEHRDDSLAPDSFERHEFSSAEDLLKFLLDAIGKHIASNQVLGERRK